tara:strand:- start:399 stop:611 length:213 start_codon:yes stop_codon:yes gene_type:complete
MHLRPIADSRDGSALQCSIHQTCRSIIGAAFSLAGRRLSGLSCRSQPLRHISLSISTQRRSLPVGERFWL